MAKRVCYIHIGPHKTGTSSIQWFLKENRAELLKYGYFVPESGANHGAHHAIVRKLCGQELRDHQQSAAAEFARALDETPSEAVVISSEALHPLLKRSDLARIFFTRMRELNLEPSQFRDTNVRRNEAAGPFTVGVARGVLHSISSASKRLKWLQAVRCGARLATYLKDKGLADAGYCGLTTTLARHIETQWRSDNDAFAQRVWGGPWTEGFVADIGGGFSPN